jgi:serine protease Do
MAVAQTAAAGRLVARTRPESLTVQDTTVRARTKVLVSLAQVDSLLRLQDELPIGSPEFIRVQFALDSLIRRVLPQQQVFVRGMAMSPSGERPAIIMTRPSMAPSVARGTRMTGDVAALVDAVVPRGWIGMDANGFHDETFDETGSFVRYFEYPIVVGVDPSSPAARSGIRFGDSLMAYDGRDLRANTINLTKLLEPGRTLAVKLRRDGEMKEFSIQIEKAPPAIEAERRADFLRTMVGPAMERRATTATLEADRVGVESRLRPTAKAAQGGRGAFGEVPVAMARMPMPTGILGAQINDIDQDGLRSLRNDKNANGVIVMRVGDGTPAYRLGLRSGDLITKVDDVKIESLWQLQHEMVTRRQNVSTKLTVLRGKKTQTLVYEQQR